MKIKLMFLEESNSDYKGKNYHFITFIDPNSLTVVRGQNIETSIKFEKYKQYTCVVEFSYNKLQVVKVEE